MILTRGYERLLSAGGSTQNSYAEIQEVLKDLVSTELRQRIDTLDEVIGSLDARIREWSRSDGYVMADTSFYAKYEHKLEEVDFASLIPGFPDKRIHVLVPVIILDELDVLKNKGQQLANWRAAYTLAVLDKIHSDDKRIDGVLQAPAEVPGGKHGRPLSNPGAQSRTIGVPMRVVSVQLQPCS